VETEGWCSSKFLPHLRPSRPLTSEQTAAPSKFLTTEKPAVPRNFHKSTHDRPLSQGNNDEHEERKTNPLFPHRSGQRRCIQPVVGGRWLRWEELEGLAPSADDVRHGKASPPTPVTWLRRPWLAAREALSPSRLKEETDFEKVAAEIRLAARERLFSSRLKEEMDFESEADANLAHWRSMVASSFRLARRPSPLLGG
jgi:hypothetical protein